MQRRVTFSFGHSETKTETLQRHASAWAQKPVTAAFSRVASPKLRILARSTISASGPSLDGGVVPAAFKLAAQAALNRGFAALACGELNPSGGPRQC
jgi:hypothetical protein